MGYKIEYKASVAKDLSKLPKETIKRCLELIEEKLINNPFLGKPLKGKFKGLWSVRIGNYRIIYTIEKQPETILILRIAHRKESYRA
ncbi:MAG: type II toxin-antitoxin system RelE/ParE family toxin [Candidatus Brocadiales bacterium]|nr:type II toxin-antitoxin system RelE/ParE family toxin [Candidatus Brocadiales bacterium]